ncbi:hypothetical protein ACFQ07_26855 [Actinomadura adrarensis]|uniref:Uncharacterized protein n=1 Tax=Actinomadura adrarensis TaxID=1819600 RepID=A0ABW3CQP2_9ACTN
MVKDDSVGAVGWTISVDSTHAQARQHTAGARKRGCAGEWVERLALDA